MTGRSTRAIVVLGEALVDIVPDTQGRAQALPGGSGLNTALGLARLGHDVRFCGTLSSDVDGAQISAFMRAERIDLALARLSARPCPMVFVTPGNGDALPAYDLRLAGSALDDAPHIPETWRDHWRTDFAHVHATSFAATIGAPGAAALDLMARARPFASTSFDPNIRLAALPDLAHTHALIAARIAQANIVKASAEDLDALAPLSEQGALLRAWQALGPRLVVVTRGGLGATAFFGDQMIEVPSPAVIVRETVGAGDTFMAGLLAQMASETRLGHNLQGDLRPEDVARWLAFGARAAAFCCMKTGCDPPHLDALAL